MDLGDAIFYEAFADVPAWNVYEPAWQRRYLKRAAGEGASLSALFSGVMLDVAWALFDLRMLRDPDADPNLVWTDITHRYLGVKRHPELAEETAFFITFDEGGGYFDSGYMQPIDFFGDGPRIPMIIVSKYTRGGHISHAYADHASFVKFIERNWNLKPLTGRSRDNLKNPIVDPSNPYVPLNAPAVSDLFDMFHFDKDKDKNKDKDNDGNRGKDGDR